MKNDDKASISLMKIVCISIILIFLLSIGVMAGNDKVNNVKIVLSSGNEMDVLTTKTSVKEILDENHIVLLEDEKVKEFVGKYTPKHYLLNEKEPVAMGPMDLQAFLFEHKYQQAEAMRNAKQVILDVAKDFEKMTGRKYGLFEEYKLDDAEIAIVCMNSTAGTTKEVVDSLREKGIKAGLLKIRVFRPFPAEEIAKALSHVKAVAVLDKADSLNGAGGALFTDITSAMQVNGVQVPTSSYVYGIGGRDTTTKEIESVYNDLIEDSKKEKIENPYRYLGLRK